MTCRQTPATLRCHETTGALFYCLRVGAPASTLLHSLNLQELRLLPLLLPTLLPMLMLLLLPLAAQGGSVPAVH